MREDEMEALLRVDGAGLRVRHEYAGYVAEIQLPANPAPSADSVLFTGFSSTRQEAIAQAWQKYQQFMNTKAGRAMLADNNGQMMFRI